MKSVLSSLLELSCQLIMKEKEQDTILKGQLLISKWLMTVHRKSLETPHRLKYALISFLVLPCKKLPSKYIHDLLAAGIKLDNYVVNTN